MADLDNDMRTGRGRGRRAAGPGAGMCGAEEGLGGGPGGGPGGGGYRRAVLEVAILASLAESDLHGYELVEHIVALAGGLVCVDSGTMYRMLRAMEQQGFVTSSWQTAESGPSRRVYTITEHGLEVLAAMAAALSARAASLEGLAVTARAAVKSGRRTAVGG